MSYPLTRAMAAATAGYGVYALVRVWTLMIAGGPLAGFGSAILLAFGAVTALLASFALLR